MKYIDFYRKFKDNPLIDLRDVSTAFAGFDRRRINEWKDKNYIRKITNNFYVFSEYNQSEDDLYFIANKLHSPSYISLESALSYHGLIPEGVFDITSVSPVKTRRIPASLYIKHLDFLYLKIKKEYFFGYVIQKYKNRSFLIADPEKALLDSVYLLNLKREEDLKEMRFNRERLIPIVKSRRMNKYLKILNSKIITNRIKILKKVYVKP